jgi:hypothetical protein
MTTIVVTEEIARGSSLGFEPAAPVAANGRTPVLSYGVRPA